MTSAPGDSERFIVTHQGPRDPDGTPAGVVAVDATHRMALVSAEPAHAELLAIAIEMTNSSAHFLIPAPPPEENPMLIRRQMVERSAPGARDALFDVLRRKYNLHLMPAR